MLAQDVGFDWMWFGIAGGSALAAALLISFGGRRYVHHLQRKAKDRADDQKEGRRLRRTSTVAGLVVGTLQVIAWLVLIVVILSALDVPLGPLFASAGIVGVALGFGAQTVVKDTLAGLFIALEGQFDVGDTVELQTEGGLVAGTVEGLNLRVTTVRQFDGTLSMVPNGTIQVTSNKTRGWGRAIVDVRVALAEDPLKVRRTLEDLLDSVADQEPFTTWLRERPQFLGVTQLTDVAQVVRVVVETQPNFKWDAERRLRELIAARMAEAGIRVPPVVAPRAEA